MVKILVLGLLLIVSATYAATQMVSDTVEAATKFHMPSNAVAAVN
ncbi:hypothetical protein [Noviherbaspirillum malthae]|nr:hypothetical protein [Noviherbaspirillum malthae]